MLIKGKDLNISDNVEMKRGLHTFLNPYSYYLIRNKLSVLSNFQNIYCDGILFVMLVRILGVKVNRVSFDMTSLAPIVFRKAEANNFTLALIGGEEGVIDKAIISFKEKFPFLNIIYTHSGFFHGKEDRDEVINQIIKGDPDIVIVGMGAMMQENFLVDLYNKGWHGYGYTCGGFFHQSASKKGDYYPVLVNKLNIRWLYRIYKEPKLIQRYFVIYPKAILCFFLDVFF